MVIIFYDVISMHFRTSKSNTDVSDEESSINMF